MADNTITVVGNITRDPELKFLNSGQAAVRLSIAAAMVITKPVKRDYLHFSASGDLCKEMSTKSNDNAAGMRRKSPH